MYRRLHEMIYYNQETGNFQWKKSRGRSASNSPAGTLSGSGYIQICLDKKIYQAHRLAWFYVYGKFPSKDLDHINRIKTDNRICNLREVTKSQNAQNTIISKANTSGIKGVNWCKRAKKWRAYIKLNGNFKSLGYFLNIKDAQLAYELASKTIHTHGCGV